MASISMYIATIANGTTTSDAIPIDSAVALGLQMPSAFTGTSITYTVSADKGVTYQALYDATGAVAVSTSVAASRSYDLPAELSSWTHFKIVSGSSEGGARTLYVVMKRP